MEQYKALIVYTISDSDKKKSFEEHLKDNGFEPLDNQSVFGLPLEEHHMKVQMTKAYFRVYSQKYLDENDTVCFIEAKMNPERKLIGMLKTDLLKDETL